MYWQHIQNRFQGTLHACTVRISKLLQHSNYCLPPIVHCSGTSCRYPSDRLIRICHVSRCMTNRNRVCGIGRIQNNYNKRYFGLNAQKAQYWLVYRFHSRRDLLGDESPVV